MYIRALIPRSTIIVNGLMVGKQSGEVINEIEDIETKS